MGGKCSYLDVSPTLFMSVYSYSLLGDMKLVISLGLDSIPPSVDDTAGCQGSFSVGVNVK